MKRLFVAAAAGLAVTALTACQPTSGTSSAEGGSPGYEAGTSDSYGAAGPESNSSLQLEPWEVEQMCDIAYREGSPVAVGNYARASGQDYETWYQAAVDYCY